MKSKKVELPNLVGMTVKDAKDALASLGLNAAISGAGDDTAVITQQSPEAGSSLDANTSVALTAEAKKAAPAANTSNSNVTKGTVDITVPSGKANQAVRIVVSDDSGSRTVFDGNAQPGERIVKDVSGTGRVQIQVYLNGALVQDQTL